MTNIQELIAQRQFVVNGYHNSGRIRLNFQTKLESV